MRLTTQELDKMQSVDIGATNADTLSDVSGMAFQKGLSREERITRFVQGAQNLYCFCVGGVGVKIEFAENGPSLQDTLSASRKERAVTSATARFGLRDRVSQGWSYQRHPCCPSRTEV